MQIAIYCGASTGNNDKIIQQVTTLAEYLAAQGVGIVYGGGHIGLMGVVADAALAKGGKVIGVMPEQLGHQEITHQHLTQLHLVKDMQARKALMLELADACVALPGGIGTLEEIFEAWTGWQLGLHDKPCAFYNVENYYAGLLNVLAQMQQANFVRPRYLSSMITANDPKDLLEQLTAAMKSDA